MLPTSLESIFSAVDDMEESLSIRNFFKPEFY
jgi:hypothetical protein